MKNYDSVKLIITLTFSWNVYLVSVKSRLVVVVKQSVGTTLLQLSSASAT